MTQAMALITGGMWSGDWASASEYAPPGQTLLKIEAVRLRFPVSRSQIYSLIAEGQFPAPVHADSRCAYWIESEIDAWIQSHIDVERAAPARKSVAIAPVHQHPQPSTGIKRLK